MIPNTFTREVIGDNGQGSGLSLLVEPATDLDSCFRAWCLDGQELIAVNGWLWSFEDASKEISHDL